MNAKTKRQHQKRTTRARDASAAPRVVPLIELREDPDNARHRGDRARGELRRSLRRFGAGRSLVADAGGVVRAGSGTLEAARAEGYTEALVVEPGPGQLVVVQRTDWTETDAAAYGIADNRTAELAEWDTAQLGDLLGSLEADDIVGFSTGELTSLPTTQVLLDSWEAHELDLRAVFVLRCPAELQAEVRAVLRERFPSVDWDEIVVAQ